MNKRKKNRQTNQQINKTKMLYKGHKTAPDFWDLKEVWSLGYSIKNCIVTIDMAKDKQHQIAK